jgi:hypothetical protein
VDGKQFDNLARSFSRGVTRRTVWRAALGAAAGWLAVGSSNAHAQENGPVPLGTPVNGCPAGTVDCDGQCVDLMSDDKNCGSCFNSCGDLCLGGSGCGEICVNGNCQCPAGLELCADGNYVCTDTSSHRLHCGACDHACEAGESCVQGICTTAGSVEETPTTTPEETPTTAPVEPLPVAQPTEVKGVSGLPSTGSGPQVGGLDDLRIPLVGTLASIGAAAFAWLRGRTPKNQDA